MEYKYTGIILSKKDVGETDRIYTIYTLEGGKIRSLAKGVRKPHAKLAASLENLILADITIERTRGLGKITGSIIENVHPSIKKNGDVLLEAMRAVGFFEKLVDLENPDKEIFDLLKEYLDVLESISEDRIADLDTLKAAFDLKLMHVLGYAMGLSSCVGCGEKLSPHELFFSAKKGGVVCRRCEGDGSITMSENSVKILRLLVRSRFGLLMRIKVGKKDWDNAMLAVSEFMRWNP